MLPTWDPAVRWEMPMRTAICRFDSPWALDDLVTDQGRIVDRAELDGVHPAGERTPDLSRQPQRQPGLPHPADAHQGDQPGAGEQALELGELVTATDKAVQLSGPACRRCGVRRHVPAGPRHSQRYPFVG
jgi:hypothetical protein